MLCACLILCLVAATRQLSITDFAVPSAVKVGENAELQCRYSVDAGESETTLFYVKWWWTPLRAGSERRQQLYQRLAGHPPQPQHLGTINIKENDTIELLNLQPKDSGTYECEVSNIDEARAHHELIVYTEGSGPEVNITRQADGPDDGDEEDVVVTCQATDVAPEAVLVITVNGEAILDTESVNETSPGVFNIHANATLEQGTAPGTEVRCELFYNNQNITHEIFVAREIYVSGDEPTTTEAADSSTLWETSTDSLQDPSGTSLSKAWALLVAAAVPVQLLALH